MSKFKLAEKKVSLNHDLDFGGYSEATLETDNKTEFAASEQFVKEMIDGLNPLPTLCLVDGLETVITSAETYQLRAKEVKLYAVDRLGSWSTKDCRTKR